MTLNFPCGWRTYLILKGSVDQDNALCALVLGATKLKAATDMGLYRTKCECIPL